jgi:hypothetical protein
MKRLSESFLTAAAIAGLAIAVPVMGQDLGNAGGPGGATDCPALSAEKAMLLAELQAVKSEAAEKAGGADAKGKDAGAAPNKRQQELEARVAEIKAAGC